MHIFFFKENIFLTCFVTYTVIRDVYFFLLNFLFVGFCLSLPRFPYLSIALLLRTSLSLFILYLIFCYMGDHSFLDKLIYHEYGCNYIHIIMNITDIGQQFLYYIFLGKKVGILHCYAFSFFLHLSLSVFRLYSHSFLCI